MLPYFISQWLEKVNQWSQLWVPKMQRKEWKWLELLSVSCRKVCQVSKIAREESEQLKSSDKAWTKCFKY